MQVGVRTAEEPIEGAADRSSSLGLRGVEIRRLQPSVPGPAASRLFGSRSSNAAQANELVVRSSCLRRPSDCAKLDRQWHQWKRRSRTEDGSSVSEYRAQACQRSDRRSLRSRVDRSPLRPPRRGRTPKVEVVGQAAPYVTFTRSATEPWFSNVESPLTQALCGGPRSRRVPPRRHLRKPTESVCPFHLLRRTAIGFEE